MGPDPRLPLSSEPGGQEDSFLRLSSVICTEGRVRYPPHAVLLGPLRVDVAGRVLSARLGEMAVEIMLMRAPLFWPPAAL